MDGSAVEAAADAVEASAHAAEDVAEAAAVEAVADAHTEPEAETAATETVAAAEAAVALAHTQAAAAELDAAERERQLIGGLAAWQEGVSSRIAAMEEQITAGQIQSTEILASLSSIQASLARPEPEETTLPEANPSENPQNDGAESQDQPTRRKRRFI